MANVALTADRRRMIIEGATKHLVAQKNTLGSRASSATQSFGQYVYNKLVNPEIQKFAADVPTEMLHWAKGVRIQINSPNAVLIADIPFNTNKPMFVSKLSGVALRLTPVNVAEYPPLLNVLDLMEERHGIEVEIKQLTEQLDKLMSPCSSLQQLCKVYPTALNHVDDRTKQMYNQRVERGKAPDLDSLLTPELKVALVKSNMTQATKT